MELLKYIEKYSTIIVIILSIVVVFLYRNELSFGRITEGFESTVANSVSAIEQKFNQAFGVINKDNVVMKQKLTVDKGADITGDLNVKGTIKMKGKRVLISNSDDKIVINYKSEHKNGVDIRGKLKTEEFCIGGTCIGEDELKVLTGGKYFSIVSARSGKRLQDQSENAKFDNMNDNSHEAMKIHKIRDK